jgi:hypothetical protein
MDACDIPQETDPVLQGDVIQWHAPRPRPPNETFGIIVNADCDIFQAKNGEQLTYVSLLNITDFADRVWAPSQVTRLYRRQIDDASGSILTLHRVMNEKATRLPEVEIRELCARNDDNAIIQSLQVTDEKKSQSLRKQFDLIRQTLECMYSQPGAGFLKQYCGLKSRVYGGDETKLGEGESLF